MPNTLGPLEAGLAARYRIEREPGQGRMAAVCLATDLRHHRDIARRGQAAIRGALHIA